MGGLSAGARRDAPGGLSAGARRRAPRGLFVTGTDTGVGKTVVAAAIVAALRAHGAPVKALKPVITGLDDPADPDWPRDHELLARVAGQRPDEVCLVSYGPPVSPHLAGELSGRPVRPAALRQGISALLNGDGPVVVEGVGGLLVPLGESCDVRQLACDLELPLVIVARPGLGTINHTLLTVEAARAAGLEVAGVVLNPWPDRPGKLERSNMETIAMLAHVPVATLPRLPRADPELLIAAGELLPLAEWLRAGA